jgi:phosphoserine phosphatase
MREFERLVEQAEIAAARTEMASWYHTLSVEKLCEPLARLTFAPGVEDGIALLKAHAISVAIASYTWEFAVQRIARRLGADFALGTRLLPNGGISHVWADDKARWVEELAATLELDLSQVAAVGDSRGDIPMLESAGLAFFVGDTTPLGLNARHHPRADIAAIACSIVAHQSVRRLTSDVRHTDEALR